MIRKFFLIFFASLALFVGILFWQKHSATLYKDPRINEIFKMKDIYNNPIASGKKEFLVINFWASWCPPCIAETPSLVRFVEKKLNSASLIALSQDSSLKEIEEFIKTFPALRSSAVTVIHDSSQTIAHAYGVFKLPETFVYSVRTNKYFQFSGSTNWDDPEVLAKVLTLKESHSGK